jgi:hypothetical protein
MKTFILGIALFILGLMICVSLLFAQDFCIPGYTDCGKSSWPECEQGCISNGIDEPIQMQQTMNLTVVGGGVAAASGPNAWYYACTATPTVEPTWTGYTFAFGTTTIFSANINIPVGGTLTKFRIKSGEAGAYYGKLALYVQALNGAILSESCTAGPWLANTWLECTLSTPYVVSSGDYMIAYIPSDNLYTYYLIVDPVQPTRGTSVYANFPASYSTFGGDGGSANCPAVAAYVQ